MYLFIVCLIFLLTFCGTNAAPTFTTPPASANCGTDTSSTHTTQLAPAGVSSGVSSSSSANTFSIFQPSPPVQTVFLIDDSSSMATDAGDPSTPRASRWDLVQALVPSFLSNLGSNHRIGAISVGGVCGSTPAISFPVGTPPDQFLDQLRRLQPSGATNLNRSLYDAVKLFESKPGKKQIILFTDGGNSCSPLEDTCEIARKLYQQFDIQINVVSVVLDPSLEQLFRCVVGGSGGNYWAITSTQQIPTIPINQIMTVILSWNPWPLIMFSCSTLSLFFISLGFYRQNVHYHGNRPANARLLSILLLAWGMATSALILLLDWRIIGFLLSMVFLGGIGLSIFRPKKIPSPPAPPTNLESSFGSSSSWDWSTISFVLLFILLGGVYEVDASPANNSMGGNNTSSENQGMILSSHPVQTDAGSGLISRSQRNHHILNLDISGTMYHNFPKVKDFVAGYIDTVTKNGDLFTVIVFSFDEQASVKELITFTIDPATRLSNLDQILREIVIDDPKKTNTLFFPLGIFLQDFLKSKVKDHPIILVVSDGKSDAATLGETGREIPFESLGKTVYSLPGVKGWKVAVTGGDGLNLGLLFSKPLEPKKPSKEQKPIYRRVGIDPCLIDPDLEIEGPAQITVPPQLNPFRPERRTEVRLQLRNSCSISRYRTFGVVLKGPGGKEILIGQETALIGDKPTEFTFPVTLDPSWAGRSTVEVVVYRGTIQRLFRTPREVSLEFPSYWTAYSRLLTFGCGGLGIVILGGLICLIIWWRRPLYVRASNSVNTVRIPYKGSVTIGGTGAQLLISALGGQVIGQLHYQGKKKAVTFVPTIPGVICNGNSVAGSIEYKLDAGGQISVTQGGKAVEFMLMTAKKQDMSFTMPISTPGLDPLFNFAGTGFGGASVTGNNDFLKGASIFLSSAVTSGAPNGSPMFDPSLGVGASAAEGGEPSLVAMDFLGFGSSAPSSVSEPEKASAQKLSAFDSGFATTGTTAAVGTNPLADFSMNEFNGFSS